MATTVKNIRDCPRGWENDGVHLYCGRAGRRLVESKYHNPFIMRNQSVEERDRVIDEFAAYARVNYIIMSGIYAGELRDRILVCYCHPKRCHCHVLASWSNALWENSPPAMRRRA